MRAALLCAALALAPLAARAAQNVPRAGSEQAAHLEALRTERTARFFEAFEAADPGARARASRLLAEEERGGAPLGERPSLASLALATRALSGADPGEASADALAAFADSLDLQVVPGAFPSTEAPVPADARGAPLTVTVYRAWSEPPARDVEVALEWIAPDGTRTRARTEPFAAGAFRNQGFPMYVRAPLAEPGAWRLVPIVCADGREAEGVPVRVECVRALEARAAAAVAQGPARARLDALLERGLRSPLVRGAEPLLAMLEGAGERAWIPLDAGAQDQMPPLFAELAGRAGAVVLLWSGGEREDLPLDGPAGDAWRALCAARGLGLYALRAAAGEPDVLRAGLAEVERRAGRPPILVARGASTFAATLLLVSAGSEQPVALSGLVLASPADAPPRVLPPCPVLCVVPAGAPEQGADGGGEGADGEGERADGDGERKAPTEIVAGARDAFLIEPGLPAIVGDWLDAL